MDITLSPQQWLTLKYSTRQALIKIFKIPQSTFTHVVNDKVESDGHTYDDLKAISLEEMKALTHLESDDYFEQFNLIVKMVESEGSVAQALPENATPNEPSTQAAGADTGTKEGVNPQAPVSQETVLPVSGGVNEVNRGSNEPVPNSGGDNTASVAAKDAEVDAKKPKAGKSVK